MVRDSWCGARGADAVRSPWYESRGAEPVGDEPPEDLRDLLTTEDLEAAEAWVRSTAAVRKLRALAKQRPRTEEELATLFNADTVRAAAKSFCTTTPAGTEALPIAQIAATPDGPLHDLALLLRAMVREAAVPMQALVHLLFTLAKKQGGYRCIAVMPSVIRILTKLLCPELEAWGRAVAHSGAVQDTAAPGANSRKEAGLRQLRSEAAHLSGEPALQLLWDIDGVLRLPGR